MGTAGARPAAIVWAVLAAIVVIAVGVRLFWPAGAGDAAPNGAAAGAAAPEPVADYLRFAGRLNDGTLTADQAVVVEGLRLLAGAVGALQLGGADLAIDLRIAAEHVVLNPDAAGTTEAVRASLLAAAAALDRASPEGPASRAAEAIDPMQPLAAQYERLARVFAGVAERIEGTRGAAS